jgi:benzoate membrane transport protein
MSVFKDCSASAISAGFLTVLVGYTSSAVIVFQAAESLGATPDQIASWMWALGIGMGVSSIALSLRYRAPIATAWSTSGAAMLASAASGIELSEAVGAFLFAGALAAFSGFSGWFERAMKRIPVSIAAGMLSGVLLRFGVEAFATVSTQLMMTTAMFAAYLATKSFSPRYAVVITLVLGVAIAHTSGVLDMSGVRLELASPVFVMPVFSWQGLIGVGIPLFVVTMASQNVPGIAVLRAAGVQAPISPLVGWTGVTTLLLAPFGGYAFNLATITAAICTGKEAHEDPNRRYVAAVAAGVFYALTGLFGAAIGSLLAAFPKELVLTIAGFALLGTIANSLASALADERQREPAIITFLVTASGASVLGIGSAFWGLVAGVMALFLLGGPLREGASRYARSFSRTGGVRAARAEQSKI